MRFLPRLWLAIVCFFRIVFDAAFAAQVAALRAAASLPAAPPAKERLPLPGSPAASLTQLPRPESALHLLAMLQREGRLIDFCEEQIAAYSDAQIGAAARAVHDGCHKAIRRAFTLAPIRAEPEGAQVSVPDGFSPLAIRLTGNVVGNPPFRGVLRHHGWKATEIHLPAAPTDPTILAPAEVELP